MTQEKEWHNGNLLVGNCLEKIKEIPDESVDCVISSPPYWGLRDYGTGKWVDGNNPDCDHSSIRRKTRKERGGLSDVQSGNEGGFGDERKWTDDICPDCNARYEDPQWGSELHFEDYLDKMMALMTEIKRILKPTGSCWINLGDSYSTQSGGMRDLAEGKTTQHGKIKYTGKDNAYNVRQPKIDLKPKTRVGIPERFMIRCIDDGWILRNHIPWVKSNAMPTSVKDRFQNKWESIFFFVKKQKYYFDLDAVREKPVSDYSKPTKKNIKTKLKQSGLFGDAQESEDRGNQQPKGRSNFGTGNDIRKNQERKWEKEMGQETQTIAKTHSGNFDQEGNLIGNPKGKNPGDVFVGPEDWDYTKPYKTKENEPGSTKSLKERMAASRAAGNDHDGCLNDPKGKNPGDVFYINPKPFIEAHFATFPEALPEKIIKCAVPTQVCKKCGKPTQKVMEPTEEYAQYLGKSWHDHENDQEQGMQQKMEKASVTASYKQVGTVSCNCNAGFQPGVVFDPFMGAGTVALVALKNHRRWLGIELNPEYVEIIKKRLKPKESHSLDSFA